MARVDITGSSIKRIAREGALPVEVISRKQIEAQGIVNAEQLIATLNINGNGSDNLASNADVTSGSQRGNNGASSANLRGQGADSTLVLLNGRRVATGGFGDLQEQGFNLLFALSTGENKALRGDQRDFVNTFQPDRGVSVDTRGTPFANVFATSLGNTIFSRGSNTGPLRRGTTQAYSGVSLLDLPGGAGCASIDGMGAYDDKLWDTPSGGLGCAWDTGRAAVLQQLVKNSNFVTRATMRRGGHEFFAELVGAKTEVAKRFSPNQVSPNAATFPASSFYPSTGAAYNEVFNALVAEFPSIEANRGLPIAYRWRCMECGDREIATESRAGRLQLGADGQIGKLDYKVGAARATSESESTLGKGYSYTAPLAAALGSGLINPFLKAGEKQSQQALDLIRNASAAGVVLYGGKTTLSAFDAALSGEVYTLPAGPIMAAVGTDIRKEEYTFNGDLRNIAEPSSTRRSTMSMSCRK
nr:Plug domain-containing protein [Massilia genomosp. 1]